MFFKHVLYYYLIEIKLLIFTMIFQKNYINKDTFIY